jgi:hypothetical protein
MGLKWKRENYVEGREANIDLEKDNMKRIKDRE